MYIERVLYPVEVLGVGKRVAIWTQGCPHGCKECINKDLWVQNSKNNIPINKLIEIIFRLVENQKVDGITITGGDPFYQQEELLELVRELKIKNLEILVYTGYLKQEILEMQYGKECLDGIDVLIDGKYIDGLNDNQSPLRGSTNQQIHILNNEVAEKYEVYLKKGRELQHFYSNDRMISVGIHNKKK